MSAPPTAPPSPERARRAAGAPAGRTAARRLVADRIARRLVAAGGIAIIASVLAILIFIVAEIAPLARGTRVRPGGERPLAGPVPGALLSDEHRAQVATLSADGLVRVLDWASGDVEVRRSIIPPPVVEGEPAPPGSGGPSGLRGIAVPPGEPTLAAATADGRVVAVPVAWDVAFDGDVRRTTTRVLEPAVFAMDPAGRPVGAFAVRLAADGSGLAAAQLADGSLAALRRSVEENLLTGETTGSFERFEGSAPGPLAALVLDEGPANLYGGTADGRLVAWTVRAGRLGPPEALPPSGAGVTAVTLLIGGRSLVVGRADGSLEVWFRVRAEDGSFPLTRIRAWPPGGAAVTALSPSARGKTFAALDGASRLGLYHSTSHRVLWEGEAPLGGAAALQLSPRADGAFLAAGGRLALLDVDNPHPEVGLRALLGKVWYEGYERPEHVWQSTGGTDDFEPKLSLTPLMIGTLKGTIYSLILAVPLGVLGAMYTSQFMHPSLKRYVKPTVEIMAALPSVVLGFLAGLWLAPRLEGVVPALALMAVVLPALVVGSGLLWHGALARLRRRLHPGAEILPYMAVVVAGGALCLELNEPLQRLLFGGDFQAWLLRTTGLGYDQRNAVVVGLAMGFAVIPIVFSIAEDAFSNVPRSLVSASLALGANRWQTVTRVVLPTASPGIFSAVMVGFGRAVGETMIVLMATGNTPIMEWNPFSGFRTLSANIAVEIPEAPHGGTLYRTLFLAALILFAFTFLVNTAAEVVRQRLRRRYAEM